MLFMFDFGGGPIRVQAHAMLLRFGTYRGRWLAAGLGLLAALILVWGIWLPGLAGRAIKHRLAGRGLLTEIADVDVALNGIVLSGLNVRSVEPGLVASVERLAIEIVPWRGLGIDAARTVDVTGLKLRVQLGQPFVHQWLERRRERNPVGDGEARKGGAEVGPALETVRVSAMDVTVEDAAGALVHGQGLRGDIRATEWELSGASLTIGASPGEVIAVEGLRAAGAREGLRPSLVKASTRAALLQWAEEVTTPSPDKFPAADGRTLARLRAAIDGLRSVPKQGGVPSKEARTGLWQTGAEINLANMRVVRGQGPEAVEILQGMSVVLTAEEGDALQARLRGQGTDSGKIDLDLRVWPHARRVEGRVELDDVSLALFAPALPPLPFSELEGTRVRHNAVK